MVQLLLYYTGGFRPNTWRVVKDGWIAGCAAPVVEVLRWGWHTRYDSLHTRHPVPPTVHFNNLPGCSQLCTSTCLRWRVRDALFMTHPCITPRGERAAMAASNGCKQWLATRIPSPHAWTSFASPATATARRAASAAMPTTCSPAVCTREEGEVGWGGGVGG